MIYFIRHGETDFNRHSKIQGQLDIPLNDTGIKQAETARDNLADLEFDLIYSSPLLRARKTAEIINEKHGVEIVFDDRLKEFFIGSVQGECVKEWSDEKWDEVHHHPENFGGETLETFINRVTECFVEIEKLNKNILIVAHGGCYRAIYKYVNNMEGFDFDIEGAKNAVAIKIR